MLVFFKKLDGQENRSIWIMVDQNRFINIIPGLVIHDSDGGTDSL